MVVGEGYERDGRYGFGDWPCTPAVAISHVSHHWRQLSINMPSLWTSLVVTPKFDHHLDPIPSVLSSMEVVIPKFLTHARQIGALTFIDSEYALERPLSRMAEQPPFTGPPLNVFNWLTKLVVVGFTTVRSFNLLKPLLLATQQLKSLELEVPNIALRDLSPLPDQSESVIHLPVLEKLTLIRPDLCLHEFLDSLLVPHLQQLRLLQWLCDEDKPRLLYVNKLPKFNKVQKFTIHCFMGYYHHESSCSFKQYRHILNALPNVTHLTLHSPETFCSSGWRRLTLHFTFEAIQGKPRSHFAWLQRREDRNSPLQISVFDSSEKPSKRVDQHLFCTYKELQEYGTVEGSRMDGFLRWQCAWYTSPDYSLMRSHPTSREVTSL
ncbi:hypothetical protein BJ138DRAFT_1160564 [Hygrophoropsis aurantiaca]|uniref:Uncharacterized protein n=1 Tax=Hygrophoropsis aurantiaca TaxID=72124 RepID=A0ACB8A2S1_9AGAM|nr:hypothetical protein BJ138DRAFT_1160564 [Hygrophoropsis aurantiaca]